jgi:hypothetical protein
VPPLGNALAVDYDAAAAILRPDDDAPDDWTGRFVGNNIRPSRAAVECWLTDRSYGLDEVAGRDAALPDGVALTYGGDVAVSRQYRF